MSSGVAAISSKHRGNAEGGVRVLGQTAAVAGISGALLLALKAMVLVSPAVLPHGAGLDALGQPNAVAAAEAPAFTYTPAAADTPIVSSERTAVSNYRTVTFPTTKTTTPSKTSNTPSTPSNPSNPSTPSTPVEPPSSVGGITKPVTGVLDGVLGTNLTKTVNDLGKTVDGTVDTVNGATGNLLKPVTDTVGLGSGSAAQSGLVPTLGNTVGSTLGTVTGTVTGSTGSGGLLSGVTGSGGLLGGVLK